MRTIDSLTDIATPAFLFESHLGVTRDGNLTTHWADTQTGSGLVALQTTENKHPEYSDNNPDFADFPTIDWPFSKNAFSPFLQTAPFSFGLTTPPMTFLCALRCTDYSAARIILSQAYNEVTQRISPLVLPGGQVRLLGNAAPFVDSPLTDPVGTDPMVLALVHGTTYAHAYKNGRLIAAGAFGNGSLPSVRIGAAGTTSAGSSAWIGNMATVACWFRALGAGELRAGTDLLMRRYEIPFTSRSVATGRIAV